MSDFEDAQNPYEAPETSGRAEVLDLAEPVLAGRGARLGAHLLDQLTIILAILPGLVLMMADVLREDFIWDQDAEFGDRAVAGMFLMAAGGLGLLIYNIVLLTTRGQTIGKRIVSIQIVCYRDAAHAGFVRAVLLRALVNGLFAIVPLVGDFYPIVDALFIFGEERRCIHDYLAGTMVVKAGFTPA